MIGKFLRPNKVELYSLFKLLYLLCKNFFFIAIFCLKKKDNTGEKTFSFILIEKTILDYYENLKFVDEKSFKLQ